MESLRERTCSVRGRWAALWGTSHWREGHWHRSSDQAGKVQLQQEEGNREESAMETQSYGNARQFSPKAWLKGKDVCSSEAVIPAGYLSSMISSFFSAQERILLVLALKGACVHAKSLQPCPTLHVPMDHSPSEFLCPWTSWARILEWVAAPSSRGSSWPRGWTCDLRLLHWQLGSLPLVPPGKPTSKDNVRHKWDNT